MEAEWQKANEINRLIARDEALATEARLAITAKNPLMSLKTTQNNQITQNQ